MVRHANQPRTAIRIVSGSTPCATHHFLQGSLHAPYELVAHSGYFPFPTKVMSQRQGRPWGPVSSQPKTALSASRR